jgi:hypothetical protein
MVMGGKDNQRGREGKKTNKPKRQVQLSKRKKRKRRM